MASRYIIRDALYAMFDRDYGLSASELSDEEGNKVYTCARDNI